MSNVSHPYILPILHVNGSSSLFCINHPDRRRLIFTSVPLAAAAAATQSYIYIIYTALVVLSGVVLLGPRVADVPRRREKNTK